MAISQLVTLARVRTYLRVSEYDATDDELNDLIDEASGIIVDYLKKPVPDDWTVETVPFPVRSAVLIVIGIRYADREGATDPLTPAVESLLMRSRDPALA